MYKIIDNLPIDYDFQSKSKKELKQYGEWFKENKNARLNELTTAVNNTKGFENWRTDYSTESLKELGAWLDKNVKTEKLSKEDYLVKRNSVPDYIKVDDWDLTTKTRSFLVDAGIYFGETLIINNKNLRWEQYFSRRKNDNDNGHMVIMDLEVETNPIWNLYIIGLGFARGKEDKNSLFQLYDYITSR